MRRLNSVPSKAKIPHGKKRLHRTDTFNELHNHGSLFYWDYSLEAEPTPAEKSQGLSEGLFLIDSEQKEASEEQSSSIYK